MHNKRKAIIRDGVTLLASHSALLSDQNDSKTIYIQFAYVNDRNTKEINGPYFSHTDNQPEMQNGALISSHLASILKYEPKFVQYEMHYGIPFEAPLVDYKTIHLLPFI